MLSQGSHFVVCAECLEKTLERPLSEHELKFEGTKKYWKTNNLLIFAKKHLDEHSFSVVKAYLIRYEKNKTLPLTAKFKPYEEFKVGRMKKLLLDEVRLRKGLV